MKFLLYNASGVNWSVLSLHFLDILELDRVNKVSARNGYNFSVLENFSTDFCWLSFVPCVLRWILLEAVQIENSLY